MMMAVQLPHGHSMESVREASRLAAHTAYVMAMSHVDRYDEAWSAIVEHLYATDTPPDQRELVRIGRSAISQRYIEHKHHHGYHKYMADGTTHGPGSSARFQAYWWDWMDGKPTPAPERRVVERLALAQIMPRLTPGERRVLIALAVHDDYAAAAASLGLTGGGFICQVRAARKRFLALWHEGERPSKLWGRDRRVGSRANGGAGGRERLSRTLRRKTAARGKSAAVAA